MDKINVTFKIKNLIAIGNGYIDPNRNFIIVGYYWGKNNINKNSRDAQSTYGDLANRLSDSCKKLGCNYFIAEVPELAKPGGYQIGINMKPEFILTMLNMFPGFNIVSIDTDMTLTGYPYIFESKDYDFMGFNWNYEVRYVDNVFPHECLTWNILHTSGGLLVFGSTSLAKRFVKKWIEETEQHPGKAEDRTISVTFNGDNCLTLMRCLWLPIEYFWIPYFYEFRVHFNVQSEYQNIFKNIKFNEDDFTLNEYNFQEFYKIKNNSIKIFHPEALTSEEMAASQGSSSNRIPDSYFVEQIRKKRCLETSSFVNIPKLYCDNKDIENELKPFLKIMEQSGMFIVEKILPEIPKIDLNDYKYVIPNFFNKEYPYIITIVNKEDEIKFLEKIPKYLKNNVIFIYSKTDKYLPFLLLEIITKVNHHILYINSSVEKVNIDTTNDLLSDIYDFQCFNENAYPIFKNSTCFDSNVLNLLTTNVLSFKNNKYGTNLLRLWCSQSKTGRNIKDKLSMVFNKYMCSVFMRSKWISLNTLIFNDYKIYKNEYRDKIQNNLDNIIYNTLDEKRSKTNIYDYLVQCGDVYSSTKKIIVSNNYKNNRLKNYKIHDVYSTFFY
jgi:hypothetical protein